MSKEIAAGTGRRKTAVARVRLFNGTGVCEVNGRKLEEYVPSEALRNYLLQPLELVALGGKLDI